MLIQLDIVFQNSNANGAPAVGQTVTWSLSDASGTVIKRGVGPTGPNGSLLVDGVDIDEKTRLVLKYEIGGVTGELKDIKLTFTTKQNKIFNNVQKVPLTERSDGTAKLTNPNRHWLTYESLINLDRYRKPSCEFKLGLFLIPLKETKIWLRDDIPQANLNAFINSFFPDLEPKKLEEAARDFWWWKLDRTNAGDESVAPKLAPESPPKTVANRDENVVFLTPYVAIPYNRFDNEGTSKAIGTNNPNNYLLRLKDSAPFLLSAWKTASRSCVARLSSTPIKEKGKPWRTADPSSLARDFEPWNYDTSHRSDGFENLNDNPYDLSARDDNLDVSLKVGVEYVGKDYQGGSIHKDVIGDWLIGCLRSDYIVRFDKARKPPKRGLILLTELLTVVEKKYTKVKTVGGKLKSYDGMQIRDISALDKTKLYMAPLNLPLVSLDLKEYREPFHYLKLRTEDPDRISWVEFWKNAYASTLGRGKALLLIRYGMQFLNPNQQNYLLEFDTNGKPTGQIAIRDLNDVLMHREVVWALFDGPGLPPQEPGGWTELGKLNEPVLKFEFTEGRPKKEGFSLKKGEETGSMTDPQFGLPGTQMLWQRFSSFGNIEKGAKGLEEDMVLFKSLMVTMSEWGIAHNKSYISTLEAHLGMNIRGIEWSRYPEPKRYLSISANGYAAAQDELSPKIKQYTSTSEDLKIEGLSIAKLSETLKQSFDFSSTIYKDEFLTQECIIISGSGFAAPLEIRMGGGETPSIVNSNYIRFDSKTIVIAPSPGFSDIRKESGKVVVLNTDKAVSAQCSFVKDPDSLNELRWEDKYSKVIHDLLASQAGQDAIKACRNRGWVELPPKFTLTFFGKDQAPKAWTKVKIVTSSGSWDDVTDAEGKIKVYDSDLKGSYYQIPGLSHKTYGVELAKSTGGIQLDGTSEPITVSCS